MRHTWVFPSGRSKRIVLIFFIILMSLYGGIALLRSVSNSLNTSVGDFWSYWRPLQFLRQGFSPYEYGLLGFPSGVLRYPIQYIDGVAFEDTVARAIPANTPVFLLLVFPFAFFTFATAKVLLLIANYLTLLLSGVLIIRIISGRWSALQTWWGVSFVVVLLALLPARTILGVGQTSILIMCSMLFGLYWQIKGQSTLAGLALGIALSKFTLGIALFAYFLHKRQWWGLIVALLVQVAGFLGISLLTGSSIENTVLDYAQLVSFHAYDEGLQISSYLHAPPVLVSIVVTAVFGLLYVWLVRPPATDELREQHDLLIFGISCCWALLAVYHLTYDLILLAFGLALTMDFIFHPSKWQLSHKASVVLLGGFGIILLVLLAPGTVIRPLLPPTLFAAYIDSMAPAGTFVIVLVTAILTAMSFNLRQSMRDTENFANRYVADIVAKSE